jgi:hypothetical protein
MKPPSAVRRLPTAAGIKCGFIENQRAILPRQHTCGKLFEIAVGLIKKFGIHIVLLWKNYHNGGDLLKAKPLWAKQLKQIK